MARLCILLALLFVGGLAMPALDDEGPGFDEDMSIFFDHTESDVEGRIVGGSQAPNGAFPWAVAMVNGHQRSYLCGASIINQRTALSAAHCIVAGRVGGGLSSTLRLIVGTNRWSSGGQTVGTSSAVNHPHYNANTIKNDIGIIRTSANFNFNNVVRAIPLDWGNVGANVACRVSGWGRTSTGGPLAPNLMQLHVNTIDGNRCRTEVQRVGAQLNMRVPHVDPNIEICTFVAVNRGTCNGDSGSALVRNSNNQQVGVVSWGLPCARGAPDMFVRVSAFRSWLQSVI